MAMKWPNRTAQGFSPGSGPSRDSPEGATDVQTHADTPNRRTPNVNPFARSPTNSANESSVTPGKIYIGTSGWVYKDWAKHFYPKEIPKKRHLEFYATRFPTVEINATFYRLPAEKLFEE